MIIINKKILKKILLILALACITLPIHYADEKNTLSEREVLGIATMCYSNIPIENFSDPKEEKNFNAKWFGGYSSPEEFSEFKIEDYVINKSKKNMSGFSAITYSKGDNIIIAFRGTDDGIIKENWEYIIPKRQHPQAKYVAQYIEKIEKSNLIGENTKLYITGHSLGGYLATYATGIILKSDKLKKHFVKTTTFNALGLGYISNNQIKENLKNIDKDKLINYKIEGDIVSLIGKHFTDFITLKNISAIDPETPFIVNKNPHFLYHFFNQEPFLK